MTDKADNIRGPKYMPERTIPIELLESWQKMQEFGDLKVMNKALGVSKPVLSKALKYGHVKNQSLTQQITEFFIKRVESGKVTQAALIKRAQAAAEKV